MPESHNLDQETMMNETQNAHALNDRRFVDMTSRERLVFIGKAFVFLVSGGFIYPTIWVD
jgi:hypothetical protein